MSNAIVSKELRVLRRNNLLIGLFAAAVILIVASLLAGLERERVFGKEISAALESDRHEWDNQGERNPHAAAHFARYAFRPASPLAVLDPGTVDFAGLAIWMQAHYQDPAAFRRAEDGGELSRYVQLTPAFLFLTIGPLILFLMLFDSVAGEREDGTLRQLLATGVSSRRFFRGKMSAGIRLALLAYSTLFVPVAVISAIITPGLFDADSLLRVLALYLTYAAYLVVFVAVAIGVSAFFRTRQAAFLALTCVWTLVAIVTPRFAADAAKILYPQIDARQGTAELVAASRAFYADDALRAKTEEDVLKRYNVASVEELPIHYGAYLQQVSEKVSEPLFDRFYSDLDTRYLNQESAMRVFSLMSPTIPAATLSRGIAGTDRIHQREFSQAAEAHRRAMIQRLNEDYMQNAGELGYSYKADIELWRQFDDFDYRMPTLSHIGQSYLPDTIILAIWLTLSFAFAHWSVQRAISGEEKA